MGNRRAEQCHNAIAGVLINGPFKTMNPGSQDLKKIIQNIVPVFGIDLLGQFHRSFDIGKKYCDLFVFSLQGAAAGQNFVGQMFGCVGADCFIAAVNWTGRFAALMTEFGVR